MIDYKSSASLVKKTRDNLGNGEDPRKNILETLEIIESRANLALNVSAVVKTRQDNENIVRNQDNLKLSLKEFFDLNLGLSVKSWAKISPDYQTCFGLINDYVDSPALYFSKDDPRIVEVLVSTKSIAVCFSKLTQLKNLSDTIREDLSNEEIGSTKFTLARLSSSIREVTQYPYPLPYKPSGDSLFSTLDVSWINSENDRFGRPCPENTVCILGGTPFTSSSRWGKRLSSTSTLWAEISSICANGKLQQLTIKNDGPDTDWIKPRK